MTSGSLKMSYTVMRGLSEPNGSWKMNWMRRRKSISAFFSSASTSTILPRSLNWIDPLSGLSARMMIFDNVVLPQPLSPTKPRHSPRRISKLTSSTAMTAPFARPPKRPLLRS